MTGLGPYGKYIRVHNRPWRFRVPNGKGKITVDHYDGYVVIRSNQPGVHHAVEIAISRSAWHALLRSAVPAARRMEGPDFDRNASLREYLGQLDRLESDKRAMKRERGQAAKRVAQRKRYLAAKRRARRT